MKGYRTIIFSALMTLVGLLGFKISPDTASHWMDVFVAIWGIGAILIRQITTTPVGGAFVPTLGAADLTKLQQDVQTLLGHSGVSLQAAAVTVSMAQKLEALAPVLQAVLSAQQPAPAPKSEAAPPAPVAVPAIDASDALTVPSLAQTPAQPSALEAAVEEAIPVVAALASVAEAPQGAPRIIAAL